eukprot:9662716-Alexandrium_andersonii.AAC.1
MLLPAVGAPRTSSRPTRSALGMGHGTAHRAELHAPLRPSGGRGREVLLNGRGRCSPALLAPIDPRGR